MSYFNKCILPGCENQVFAAKLCKLHYDREMELSKKRKVFRPDIFSTEYELNQALEEMKHETA